MMDGLMLSTFFDRSNPYHVRARRRYRGLSDEQRAEIDRGFERHRRACENCGVDPDPSWICEAVDDLVNERE
jgi:hypothetical protein